MITQSRTEAAESRMAAYSSGPLRAMLEGNPARKRAGGSPANPDCCAFVAGLEATACCAFGRQKTPWSVGAEAAPGPTGLIPPGPGAPPWA